MAKPPLRIYAASAFVMSSNGRAIHSVYTAGSTSPQDFMDVVQADWWKSYPLEDGYLYHSFSPAVEVSQALIDEVIASTQSNQPKENIWPKAQIQPPEKN